MQTETKMTAAEAIDAIFGPGSSEGMESVPHDYTPPPPGHSVRLKVGRSGLVSLAHPQAPLGRHNGVRIVQINSVPPGVPASEVIRRYSGTVDLSDSIMWEYTSIGVGRIVR